MLEVIKTTYKFVLDNKFISLLIFFELILLIITRYYCLGRDFVGFDDFYFKDWSYVFMKELENHNWDNLPLTIQPGVITIYSNIIGFKALYFFNDKLGLFLTNPDELDLMMHTFQKIPQTTFIIGLSLVMFWLVGKLSNVKLAVLFMAIYIFEPVFIAHSRIIQTDMLQAILLFISVLFVLYAYQKEYDKRLVFLSGIFGGLAFIEKSPSFVILFFIPILLLLFYAIDKRNLKREIKELIVLLLLYLTAFSLTSFLLYPAFWGQPLVVLKRLTYDSLVFGLQGYNAENYTYEKYISSSPWSLEYLDYLLSRTSFVYLFGLSVGMIMIFSSSYKIYSKVAELKMRTTFSKIVIYFKNNKILLTSLFFGIFYFLILQVSDKKFGRYLVVVLLPLTIASAYGYYLYSNKHLNRNINRLVIILLAIGLYIYISWMPDIMGYNNMFSDKFKGQKVTYDSGAGFYMLSKYLNTNFGINKSVAIGDPKSLEIYYNGKVRDASYARYEEDLIILTSRDDSRFINRQYTYCGDFGIKKTKYFYIYCKNN